MNTINEQPKKSKPVTTAIIALAVGAGIGVLGTRWYETRASQNPSAEAQPAADQVETSTSLANANSNPWNPFQEMRNMRSDIDQLFQRSEDRLHNDAKLTAFFNDSGYASSLEVRDLKDRVEVDAYLPDARTADAQVNVNGDELSVEVTNKKAHTIKDKNQVEQVTEWGQYHQVVQLPPNVQPDKMKVERKDHELLITLPKAS